MDEPALKSLIACLDKQIDSLHVWFHIWTLMVILGCAGELLFVIHEYLDDKSVWYKARARGFIAFPERPSIILLALEVLSVAFVVVGIAGELSVDFKSGHLETQRRDANTKLVLLLEGRADDAETAAKGAAKAAASAQESSDRAREDAAKLQLEVMKQGPRSKLLSAHRDDLIKKLRPFAGQRFTPIEVAPFSDTEVTSALFSIMSALDGAGWINNLQNNTFFNPPNTSGGGVIIRILPNASEETRRSAKALFSTLNGVLLTGVKFADNGDQMRSNNILPSSIRFDEQTVLVEVGEHPTPR